MVILRPSKFVARFCSREYTKLAEVGILEHTKPHGNYDIGQLFLHRIFSYRGIVLFPWQAKVYDRNNVSLNSKVNPANKLAYNQNTGSTDIKDNQGHEKASTFQPDHPTPDYEPVADYKQIKGYSQTYYQTLIDARDSPFIRTQSEAVTFLGNQQNSRSSLYAIPGLDYVSHEDILPYTTTEEQPFYHELFSRFIHYDSDAAQRFKPKDTLKIWQEKNFSWLELSEVHRETTENVRVTVIPFYMGCRETNNVPIHWWRYSIRIENLSPEKWTVQLRERHWRIFSLSGTLETVRGRGVVGQEPVLSRGQAAFQYSSHVSLQCPSGHMWGTFRMERNDGHTFDCRIPPFALESKNIVNDPSTGPDHNRLVPNNHDPDKAQ